MTYLSHDFLLADHSGDQYPEEFLNTLSPSGLPRHQMTLKVGTPVILIRNLNAQKGLMNGTRLIIQELHEKYIVGVVQRDPGLANLLHQVDLEDNVHIIPRISCCPTEDNMTLRFVRLQIPVLPAFCLTINKSQGQTLQAVGLFLLNKEVFCHGQLYVAESRVGDPLSIKVLPKDGGKREGKEGVYVNNVVYDSAFPPGMLP